MSDNFLPVEYDPVNFKLFAPRAISGIEEVVDLPEVTTVTSGSVYTVTTSDQNKFIKIQSTTQRIDVPAGAFQAGSQITFFSGAGNQLSLKADGSTITTTASNLESSGIYYTSFTNGKITLTCLGDNTWIAEGDLSPWAMKNYVLTAATGQYKFTGSGLTNAVNPNLTLGKGQLVEIENTVASAHPFWIKQGSSQQTGTGSISPGWARIDNNGTDNASKKIYFSFNETGEYYYICQYHSAMKGTITVT